MPDIYCPRCGEPWDIDELHEIALAQYGIRPREPGYNSDTYAHYFKKVREDFYRRGCAALEATCSSPPPDPEAAQVTSVLASLMGDDIDGVITVAEDYLSLRESYRPQ